MLSNPLHRYSPYTNSSASTLHSPHGHSNPFGSFSHGSHYGVNQLAHHVGPSNSRETGHTGQQGHHTHRAQPSGSTGKVAGASGPVRRRISRACDQCNQLRTKCDGKHPCAHCIGRSCLFQRQPYVLVDFRSIINSCSGRRIWSWMRIYAREKEAW